MSFLYWFIHYILTFVSTSFFFWLPPLRKRLSFEAKNLSENGSRSFSETKEKADLAFEFSSEGEFQQVASLIADALTLGKKVELVFFSPSVEKAILDLASKHPTQLRYLRYPIASFGFSKSFSAWVTSPELILVRYDLFPEFLFWSARPGHTLKMVWVTFKKERSLGKTISTYKTSFLKAAKHLVYATQSDQTLGETLGLKGFAFDFRMEQIERRLKMKDEKFEIFFSSYLQLKRTLEKYPREKRLIIGNAWPVDMALIKNLPLDFFILVVPHQLEQNILNEMMQSLKDYGRSPLLMEENFPGESSAYVLNKKGVLCELYSDFGHAYVGGGFGVSVHSLLEPLVAGSEMISCGPVHHRSTEFDLARDLGSMTEVKNAQDFLNWMSLPLPIGSSRDKILKVSAQYPLIRKDVLSC